MGANLSAEASWIHTDADRPALLLEPRLPNTSAKLWGQPTVQPALDRGLHSVTSMVYSQQLPWSPHWWVTLAGPGRLAVQHASFDAASGGVRIAGSGLRRSV